MCQYLGNRAPNAKKKGTLFPSTLKVREKKSGFSFSIQCFVPQILAHWHIVNSLVTGYKGSLGGWQGGQRTSGRSGQNDLIFFVVPHGTSWDRKTLSVTWQIHKVPIAVQRSTKSKN